MSPDPVLAPHLDALERSFRNPDRYAAHRAAAPVLAGMARDSRILHAVFRQALEAPGFFERKRNHALIGFEIAQTADFHLVTNCFLPLPDRSPDVSNESIHHHGNLLLTTVAVFGEGYESFVFRSDFEIDKAAGEARLRLDRRYMNHLHHVAFVGARTPHVVFYPRQLSITYALWSTDRRPPFARVRRLPIVQRFKAPVIRVVRAVGATRLADLNLAEDIDFYPDGGTFRVRHDRSDGYTEGTSDNFVQNVFHILQQAGFADRPFLERLRARCLHEHPQGVRWIDALLNGESIPDRFEPGHLNLARVNFRKDDLLALVS